MKRENRRALLIIVIMAFCLFWIAAWATKKPTSRDIERIINRINQ